MKNPLAHLKPTRAQLDKAYPDRYVVESFGYGMQYYVAARFAVAAGLTPVGATLAHHALEAMLKACAAESATKEQILNFKHKQNFGHDLLKLWAAFQAQHSKAKLHGFKTMIRQLNDFENIRFAEQVIERGSQVESMFQPRLKQQYGRRRRVPLFILRMDLFDKLVRTIFRVANKNPEFYRMYYEGKESGHHYRLRNRFQF